MSFDDHADGFDEQAQVHGQRPVFDVVGVEADFFFKVKVGAAGGLTQARDAGLDGQQEFVMFLVFFYLFGQVWSRANEAHVTTQHIPKLRQFIDIPAAYEMADASDAGVVFDLN